MKSEERIWKASILAGISDMLFGLIMMLTGWHDWYWRHFHTFGVLGVGMIAYGVWHKALIWKKQKRN